MGLNQEYIAILFSYGFTATFAGFATATFLDLLGTALFRLLYLWRIR